LAIARPTVPMEVSLWDTVTGQEVFTIKSASQFTESKVQALSWSADGATLAVADEVGDVRLWSVAPRTEEVQRAHRTAWADYSLAWHRRAARDAERERRWFAAAFHLSRVIDADPADGSLFLRRGLANAQAARWADAADDLDRAIELDRIETFEVHYQQALLLRKKGDVAGYREARAFLLEHWGDTTDAKTARKLLQACLLDSEKAVERKSVERLVQVMLSVNQTVVFRARKVGTYAELRQLLIELSRKGEKRLPWLTWLFFPLVCERLGDEYEAAFWLDQAARQTNAQKTPIASLEGEQIARVWGKDVGWEYDLVVDLLQQEIEALRKTAKP
jgi:hypothetical protein